MLEHLLAVDEIEAGVLKRHRDAVEGLEAGIPAGAFTGLGRAGDVEPDPLDGRVAGAEHVDGAAGAAPEVEHPPGSGVRAADLALGVAVGEGLPGVIAGHGVGEQLLQVATGQPQQLGPLAA